MLLLISYTNLHWSQIIYIELGQEERYRI